MSLAVADSQSQRSHRYHHRGKAKPDMELYYSTTSDVPCKKHPSSSSVGICAYCLKDRLIRLVCSDCGEQRLSSCSCSEISSNRNSCSVDIGSVGRVSFLIENDPGVPRRLDEAPVLRRSSSTSAEVKRRPAGAVGGFWGLGKLFGQRRKGEKARDGESDSERNAGGVSRSRSLCSFRGGAAAAGWFLGSEDAAARSSSATTACAALDSARRSGFSEPRKSDIETAVSEYSGFVNGSGNRRVFSLRESDFGIGGVDESGFIDLKLDPPESKYVSESSETRFGSMRELDFNGGLGFSRGGSCRVTVSDRGVKRGRKGWRWIFRKKDCDRDHHRHSNS